TAGVYIPHLCHHPEFVPHGSCRICVVCADGRELCACTTPAVAGMQVESDSDDIRALRVALLQMLFVEGNHVCPGCEKSGACQLQAVAYYCGMLDLHFHSFFPYREVDASHPDAILDRNRCILCELCVRASRDHDGKSVFAISGRGMQSRLIVNSPSGRLGDSLFSGSDRAAQVCPVGAILPRRGAFQVPIGERLYDRETIADAGGPAADDRG
ncbi:MAG TPA: NADP oxidoreductase, partial [Chromatiaceae bacterium]|nr:NADP oxidoreductase [Chromatiaceae bacterium]